MQNIYCAEYLLKKVSHINIELKVNSVRELTKAEQGKLRLHGSVYLRPASGFGELS